MPAGGNARHRWFVVFVLALAALVAGMVPVSAGATASTVTVVASPTDAPGRLLSATPVTDLDPALVALGAHEWRVVYASRSGLDDRPVAVSGMVIAPAGSPPPGGWPILALAHGTTGVADACAPSATSNLAGQLPDALPALTHGFVVTATDYEGLGTPGPHPYLVPAAAGRDVIDSVRAARALVPHTSTRWAVFGQSQGGQAAWAADELAGTWGVGLHLLGAAVAAPVTNLAGAADGHLTRYQRGLLPLVLYGLQQQHPDLRYTDYLSGEAAALAPLVPITCGLQARFRALPPTDFRSVSAGAADRLRTWLTENALPRQRAAAPLFVAQGTADEIVRSSWTDATVRRACRLGDVIDYVHYDGAGHPAMPVAGPAVLRWLSGRFAGRPAPDNCPHG
jgi:hypothetical protein